MDTEVAVAFDLGRRAAQAEEPTPAPRYPARVARLLAHALDARLKAGEFRDYADMARALGFTRARITQIMDLLLLAPDIQEEILFLETSAAGRPLNGADLRSIVKAVEWPEQRRRWARRRDR